MHPAAATDDASWTSAGLARPEAVREWREWAARTIAPIDVCVFDESAFAARWSSHGVGQLRLLRLEAPAQRVVHCGDGAGKATPSINPSRGAAVPEKRVAQANPWSRAAA